MKQLPHMGFFGGMLRKEGKQPTSSAFTSLPQKPVSDVFSSHFPNWNIKDKFLVLYELVFKCFK